MSTVPRLHRAHPGWAWLGLACALLGVLAALCSGAGYRLGWWSHAQGFRVLGAAVAFGAVGALLSVVAGLANWGLHRHATARAVAGLAIGLAVVAIPLQWKLAYDRLPRIHDISSDTQDPPLFVAAARLRAPGDHAVIYAGTGLAIKQQAAYPDIRPLHTRHAPQRAYQAARAVLADMGMRVVGESAPEGRLEAVDRTLLFGFKDDFVVRVRAGTHGARIDARSMSRLGASDLGKNARRLRTFFTLLRERLED